MNHFRITAAALAAGLSAFAGSSLACSSCGCSLGSEWADNAYSTNRGLRLDLRYDFVDQNQLRYGSHRVRLGSLSFPSDDEIQLGTLTRFYTLSADYAFNGDWGLSVQAPYLRRDHQTIGEGDTETSTSATRGIGDVRVIGRYQGFFADRSWGLQLGLKLPTGKTDERFRSGPAGEDGEIIDRGLQHGTGTTDLIAGVYHYAALSRDWDQFQQLQIKQAINRHQDFRPSTQLIGNAGLRYLGFGALVPQIQLNARIEGRETGAQADYANSGSQVLNLSPGLAATLGGRLSLAAFVQLPVYQHYTGYQLAPHYLSSVNLGYRF